jgi:hypothetical protein
MFGRASGPPTPGGPEGPTPTIAETEAMLPPLRKFVLMLRQTERVEVLAHETNLGYAAIFKRYRVVGPGQVREQIVAAFGGCDWRMEEDEELPFDPSRSRLSIQ